MYKNAATGFYEHDFRIKGVERYHLSYGVKKKAEAEPLHATAQALFRSKEIAVIEAMRSGHVSLEQLHELRLKGRPFSEVFESAGAGNPWPSVKVAASMYTEALRANPKKAKSTGKTAELQLRAFVEFCGAETPIDQIGAAKVTAYQAHLYDQGLKTNTVTAKVWRVSAMYHWHRRLEERTAREEKRAARPLFVPIDHETISTEKTSRLRYLDTTEAERLLAATPAPLLFPIAAGLYAGLRVDEVLHLRTKFDIDLELGLIAIQPQPGWRPKTKRSVRHIPISAALRPILEHHVEHFASDEWMVPSIKSPERALNSHTFGDHFRRIVEEAELIRGLKDPAGVTFHVLRHTFASWLLMRGVDMYTVAKLLGNTPAQVEGTYGHLSKDFKKEAVDRLAGAVATPTLTIPDDGESLMPNAPRWEPAPETAAQTAT